MFLSGRFAAATASLLLAGALFVPSTTETKAAGANTTSSETADLAVLPSPLAPWKGAPLRVVFAVEKPLKGELVADRARRQRRREIARPPRRPAVFLVRRGRLTGRRNLARGADARQRAARVQHHHARNRRARR